MSQGHNVIFKGLKMTFRIKILKKNYTTSISVKNTTNFVFTTFLYGNFFILTALLIAVKLNFSDSPRDQYNLLKLLSALSAIATPSTSTLQNLCTFLVRVPALGAPMAESTVSMQLFNKRAALAESAVKKKIKKLCDNAC